MRKILDPASRVAASMMLRPMTGGTHGVRAGMKVMPARLVLGLVLAAGLLGAGSSATAKPTTTSGPGTAVLRSDATSTWHRDTIPNVGYDARLLAVAAISRTDAWAVGDAADHWDGHSWSRVPVPAFGNFSAYQQNGVAAIPKSGGQLWAVGVEYQAAVEGSLARILKWQGGHWHASSPVNPGTFNRLNAVIAFSATNAWAVGSTESNTTTALVEHWNGTSWKVVPTPAVSNDATLASVAAISPSDIWAAGTFEPSNGGEVALVEHWDGHHWSTIATSATQNNTGFQSITIGPSGLPIAAGFTANGTLQTLVEQWDGGHWNIIPTPNPGDDDQFLSVTEDGQGTSWAVGLDHRPETGVFKTLVERWNGTEWQVESSRNLGEGSNVLQAVTTIPGSEDLWAVGGEIEHRGSGGRWSVSTAPNAGVSNTLRGVAITGAGRGVQAWAVGYTAPGYGKSIATAFLRKAGSGWKRVGIAQPPEGGRLDAIAAPSPSDIWAVGERRVSNTSLAMAEHWNGASWELDNPPAVSGSNVAELDAVCAVSPANLWAGSLESNGTGQPVFEHVVNGHWSTVAGPAASGETTSITGLACAPNGEAWAVGGEYGTLNHAIVLHWDGHSWTAMTVPQPFPRCQLFGISFQSHTNMWAVGACNTTVKDRSLTEHWNGSAWTYVASPQPDVSVFLKSVQATSRQEAWAVGDYSHFKDPALVDRWNGSAWSRDQSGTLAAVAGTLNSVAMAGSNGSGWAVGSRATANFSSANLVFFRHG